MSSVKNWVAWRLCELAFRLLRKSKRLAGWDSISLTPECFQAITWHIEVKDQ